MERGGGELRGGCVLQVGGGLGEVVLEVGLKACVGVGGAAAGVGVCGVGIFVRLR